MRLTARCGQCIINPVGLWKCRCFVHGAGVLFETVPTGSSTGVLVVVSQSISPACRYRQAFRRRSTTTSLVASCHVAVHGKHHQQRPAHSPVSRSRRVTTGWWIFPPDFSQTAFLRLMPIRRPVTFEGASHAHSRWFKAAACWIAEIA